MLTEAVLLAISIILILFTWMSNRPKLPKTYPKGPLGWPVIGNLLQLGSQPHLKLTEWSRKHGAVYSLNMYKTRVVVLNSYKVLAEAMVERKTDFAGRPRDFITWKMWTGCKDLGLRDYSEFCKVLRKDAHTALRIHGSERWIEVITMQVDKLTDTLSQRSSSAVDPNLPLTLAAFNTISELSHRRSCEEDDKEFIDFVESNIEMSRYVVKASVVDFVRWLKPFFKSVLDRFQEITYSRVKYMEGRLKTRKKQFNREIPPRDAIDVMLRAQDDYQSNPTNGISAEDFDDTVVLQTVLDFFGAGSETVVFAAEWFLIDMMLNPEIQKKIHQEIDAVVGVDRRPVYADQDNLPYLKAAMYETMRLHTIVPLSIFHRTICTTSVNGCQIPDDTIIIPNHWAIDHDPDVFKDPYAYTPERFIDPHTGRCVSFNEMNFAPFGMGKRSCLGEMLARMEYFLIVVNLLHKFEIKVSNHGKPSTEGVLGLGYCPKPFKMVLGRRNVEYV
ncbi:steroid 17-alpha-hydroxylase/17,20 lyase-like [Glandiceps talaboti]